jgi:hypothetical protein
MLESAAIAHEIGWAWWESGQLHGAAALERTLGKLDAAEGHALRSLELTLASATVGAPFSLPPSLRSSPRNAVTPSGPVLSGELSRANRPPGPSDNGRTGARSSKPWFLAWTDRRLHRHARKAACCQSPRRPAPRVRQPANGPGSRRWPLRTTRRAPAGSGTAKRRALSLAPLRPSTRAQRLGDGPAYAPARRRLVSGWRSRHSEKRRHRSRRDSPHRRPGR